RARGSPIAPGRGLPMEKGRPRHLYLGAGAARHPRGRIELATHTIASHSEAVRHLSGSLSRQSGHSTLRADALQTPPAGGERCPPMRGIHHVTAIAGRPNVNFDFYTRTLGLRFVKKTVNFDDPGTYHFYYGD